MVDFVHYYQIPTRSAKKTFPPNRLPHQMPRGNEHGFIEGADRRMFTTVGIPEATLHQAGNLQV